MEHLNTIVEQILDFARKSEPRLATVNVNSIIEELALLVRHKLKAQNVHLIRNLESDLPHVMAEKAQLEQAFLNLILNAVEAMPQGGLLTITSYTLKRSGKSKSLSKIALVFADTGRGMTAKMRQDAFSSVLKTTKPEGTGIGLAIVRRVLETHRGKMNIKSQAGKGTSITIILPV
jgi:signal transduction histidine kinase